MFDLQCNQCQDEKRLLLSRGSIAFFTFTGSGIVLGVLSAHGEASTVTQAAIASDIHESFDVHLNFGAEGAFDFMFTDHGSDAVGFIIRQRMSSFIGVHPCLFDDFFGAGITDTEDIGQRNNDTFVFREINSGYTCQTKYPPLGDFNDLIINLVKLLSADHNAWFAILQIILLRGIQIPDRPRRRDWPE